jgi:CHAD domain-containing protein
MNAPARSTLLTKLLPRLRADFASVAQDPNAVHAARLALRRLDAAARVLKADGGQPQVSRLRVQAKALRRRLGDLRDLDVLIHETVPALQRLLPNEPALAELARAAAERRAALSPAFAALREEPDSQALLSAGSQFAAASRLKQDSARGILAPRVAKLRKMMRNIDDMSEQDLHAARIRLRTFRYLVETLAPALPKKKHLRLRKALTALHEILGRHNDAAIAVQLAAKFASEANGAQAQALARCEAIIAGWAAGRRECARRELPPAWKKVDGRSADLLAAL